MAIKKLFIVFLMIPLLLFSGCWSSHEVNTIAITIAMGIDKAENGYLFTIQSLNPKAIASKNPTMTSPVVSFSEIGKDLEDIMRRISTKSGRLIYNSHLRIVVINEDVAKEGIKDILDFFARYYQFRTDFYFVVAKGTSAREVLSILPAIGEVPGIKMYDSLKHSEQIWAPTKSIRIVELVNTIAADGNNAVLTGVEMTQEISDNNMRTNSVEALQASEPANRTRYFGLGVFKKDKLIGWLNEEESKGYNYIRGNVKSTVGTANYGENIEITAEVINAGSVIKASLINGKPSIDVEINVKQNIGTVRGEFDVSKEENKKILSEIAEKKIKALCEKVVHKAQNDLKSDIFGFGEVIHRKYPKLWEKIKDDWNNEFAELPVNISVEVKINQLGQITKPFFIKGKK